MIWGVRQTILPRIEFNESCVAENRTGLMQQVKIFKSIESELDQLEVEMNKWIARLHKKGGKVVKMEGNIAPKSGGGGPMSSFSASDVLVIILFEIELNAPAS